MDARAFRPAESAFGFKPQVRGESVGARLASTFLLPPNGYSVETYQASFPLEHKVSWRDMQDEFRKILGSTTR